MQSLQQVIEERNEIKDKLSWVTNMIPTGAEFRGNLYDPSLKKLMKDG